MLDKFDLILYEKFLDLKAEYNKDAPFNRDATIMSEIVNKILTEIKQFYTINNTIILDSMRKILISVAETTKKWKEDTLNSKDSIYQVQIQPFNRNLDYPQITHDVEPLP